MRLQTRLLLILAAALLPAVGVQVFNEHALSAEREREVADNARREAELVRAAIVGEIFSVNELGLQLARAALVEPSPEGCARRLEPAVALARIVAVRLYDADAALRCAVGESPGLRQSAALVAEVMAAGSERVGAFAADASGRRVVPAAYVLGTGEGGGAGYLVIDVDLDWVGEFLARLDHPPKRTIVVADRHATILARYPDHDRYVGSPFFASVAPLVAQPAPGNALIPSFDGLDRLIGYIPPATPPVGLWTSVGYVMADLTVDIDRAATRGYALIAASAILAAALALLTARQVIGRPVAALLDATRRLRQGDFAAAENLRADRSEIGDLARAFAEMAAALEARQARADLLLRELNHRVRNTIATAIGLANGAARGQTSVESYRDTLADRLNALARVQTLGFGESGAGESLAAVIEAEFAPYAGRGDRARHSASGPPVLLDGPTLQALGLGLHELATNAAKYGALSIPSGRVDIAWSVAPGSPPTLALAWRERGGPPVAPPARQGFGGRLLRQLVELQLGGRLALRYPPEGLEAEIEVPLVRRAAQAPAEARAAPPPAAAAS